MVLVTYATTYGSTEEVAEAVAKELFGGKFDPNNMRMPYKLLPALKRMGEGDIRDWEAIRAWAAGLPSLLKPGTT
jgi:hypothetical protein